MSKAQHPFWLDAGDDFESVAACRYHPTHKWQTFRLGDMLETPRYPDELLTICVGCFVTRCGTTGDRDRCLLWRHHLDSHVPESGPVLVDAA